MMNAEQKQFVQLLRRYLKRNTARYQRWNELGDRPQFSLTPDEMAEFQRMDRSLRAEIFLDMPERLLQIIDAQQAVIDAAARVGPRATALWLLYETYQATGTERVLAEVWHEIGRLRNIADDIDALKASAGK
jgi:hypothetical protein